MTTESPAAPALAPTVSVPAILPVPGAVPARQSNGVFFDIASFEHAQRMARAIASSKLVPETYRGPDGLPNVLIAMDMAMRVGASVMVVMQNLHIIHGRPSWSATYIIAAIESSGKFSPLRFKIEGEGDARSCRAYATELATGEILTGGTVSIAMAKAEGWYGRSGSKWPTMPDQMLMYRAASFFGRVYAAAILAGLPTADEAEDMIAVQPAVATAGALPAEVAQINDASRSASRPRRPRSGSQPQDVEQVQPAAPAASAAPPAAAPAPAAPIAASVAAVSRAMAQPAPAPAAVSAPGSPSTVPGASTTPGRPLEGSDGHIIVHDDEPDPPADQPAAPPITDRDLF